MHHREMAQLIRTLTEIKAMSSKRLDSTESEPTLYIYNYYLIQVFLPAFSTIFFLNVLIILVCPPPPPSSCTHAVEIVGGACHAPARG